jgi:formylglycine-generating enzyme required for sulfatase activity
MAGTFTKTSGQITSFTPAYGAPEQFSRTHGSTGPWTDVFALGLIVAEVIAGRDPLEGDDYVQLAVASANPARRPTPRTLGASVGDDVEAVLGKALAVKPADRWQMAGDFWNALRRAAKLEPMRGVTDTSPRSATRASSNPVASAATIAAPPSEPQLGAGSALPHAHASTNDARGPRSRRTGLFAALGVAIVAVVGVAARMSGVTGSAAPPAAAAAAITGTNAGASTPPPASAGASAAAAAHACPAGMIGIPGGSFFMGSDDGLAFEKPSHQVALAPYCIDEFEVTVDKYRACSDAGRCKRAGSTNDWPSITDKEHKAFDPLCNIHEAATRGRHPINCIDWEMADKFCREQGARLPTEAEWEFAARGPDGRKYPWGDEDPAAGYLNACGKECVAWGLKNGVEEKAMYDVDDGYPNTAPVGSFPKGASRYGVQDVVGNVWEWVADWYDGYEKDEKTDPKGPSTGEARVIRGGAWNGSYASWVRPTFRYKDTPLKRSYGIGFRCAR